MKILGCILLWTGCTAAATSHAKVFGEQAERSRAGPAAAALGVLAAAEEDYSCSESKPCEIGCCGPL